MTNPDNLAAEAGRIASLQAEAEQGDQRALREADERRATLSEDGLDAIEAILTERPYTAASAEGVATLLRAIGRSVHAPVPEPAYTVIGVYEDGPASTYQRFAEVFYTHNGPALAEALAEEWAHRQDGEPEIIIAAVLRGAVELADAAESSEGPSR